MNKKTAWIGLDVHKNSITMAVLIGRDETPSYTAKLPNDPAALARELKRHAKKYQIRTCYEAGGCGFVLARELRKANIDCLVAATALIPKDHRKVKTDRRDAEKLASFLRSGLLRPVTIPDEDLERCRDLMRFRHSIVNERKRAQQRILSFLLRKGIKYPDKVNWSEKFLDELRGLKLDQNDRIILDEAIAHYDYHRRKVADLQTNIAEIAERSFAEEVKILTAFRGIDTLSAMMILTHVPNFQAFDHPGRLASYARLTPGEHSSGETRRSRGVNKAGSAHLSRVFVTAAQQYTRPPSYGYHIKTKRMDLPASLIALVDRCERRCRKKYYSMTQRGKHSNKAKVAVGRELVGFVWEAMIRHHDGELRIAA